VGALRLVGILESGEALAILESDTSAYVVQPGDEIEPETQVVQIDLAHERVEIQRHGVREELRLLRAGRI
jgi:stress response protein YsnF